MTTQLAPYAVQRFQDNNNNPLAGGQLYTYVAGTSTPQPTYTDYTGNTPNTNPVVMNARGEANVWLTPGQAYKFVLKDASANTIWTVDHITGGSTNYTLNVKDFGALGDGVTDDTAAIQAAITTAGNLASGATVFFPDGKYLVSSTLNISKNNVMLEGFSRMSTQVIRKTAFGPMFNFTTGTSTMLYGCGLSNLNTSDNSANSASGVIVNVDNAQLFRISDVSIFGGTSGIVLKACISTEISHVIVSMQNPAGSPTGRYGIQITTTAIVGAPQLWGSNIFLDTVNIYGGDNVSGTYSNMDDGIRIEACDGVWMSNCYMGAAKISDFHLAHTNASAICVNIFVVNSMMDICLGNGVLIDGTQSVQQVNIQAIVSCAGLGAAAMDGVRITGPVNRLTFQGTINGWKSNGFHIGATGGVVVNDITVTGSVINSNSGSGVNIDTNSGTNFLLISGNDLTNNTTAALTDNTVATTTKNFEGNLGYNPPWLAYTPTISSNGGSITAVATGSYKKIGNLVNFQVKITSVTADTGTGFVIISLPPNAIGLPINECTMAGSNMNSNVACVVRTSTGSGNATMTKYDGTYPSSVGQVFSIAGSYQVA